MDGIYTVLQKPSEDVYSTINQPQGKRAGAQQGDPTPPVSAAGKASSYRRPALVLLILCCLLLAAIIALAVYHFKTKEDPEKYTSLSSNYSSLLNQLQDLSRDYSNLNKNHSELQSNYSKLSGSHSELQSNYSRLQKENSELRKNNTELSVKSSILDKYCPLKEGSSKDSNCNLCPEKWMRFNGKCYYFSTDNMNWNSSRDNCASMGGHLVIIESKAEQDFLSSQTGCKEYWIGLNDQAIEGQWRWVDNTTLNTNETYWGKREDGVEPDNYTGEDPLGEDCVHFAKYKNFTPGWYDASCTLGSYQRICETVAAIIKPRYL